jgi:hypothetical protein
MNLRRGIWVGSVVVLIGVAAYLYHREHRYSDRSKYYCSKTSRICYRGLCEGDMVGGECFERTAAYCYNGAEDTHEPRQCAPTKEECDEWIKDNGTEKPRLNAERSPREPAGGTYCRELHGDEFSD